MKKKLRFRNAEEKRKHEEAASKWGDILKKYAPRVKLEPKSKLSYTPKVPAGREKQDIPSVDTGTWSTAPIRERRYSGDAMIGIGMMHKSNLVPIFKAEEAKDIASMRR